MQPHDSSPACLDGEVLRAGDVMIPATDEGLIRGDGVFEVVRLYDGQPFALEEHLARLQGSGVKLRLPVDVERVREDVAALLDAAAAFDGLLRIVLTRGGRRLAFVEALPDLPPTMRLGYVTYSPTRVLDGIKSLSYAANMLATRLAQERGFDEALLVTPHGRVLEAPTSSLFWVSRGTLFTPPLDDHILASITRARLLELTDAAERPCTPDDLEASDEAFLASTVREVLPISAVEGRELSTGGPVTAQAERLLRERIGSELARAATA